jgi:hypothetical protein
VRLRYELSNLFPVPTDQVFYWLIASLPLQRGRICKVGEDQRENLRDGRVSHRESHSTRRRNLSRCGVRVSQDGTCTGPYGPSGSVDPVPTGIQGTAACAVSTRPSHLDCRTRRIVASETPRDLRDSPARP